MSRGIRLTARRRATGKPRCSHRMELGKHGDNGAERVEDRSVPYRAAVGGRSAAKWEDTYEAANGAGVDASTLFVNVHCPTWLEAVCHEGVLKEYWIRQATSRSKAAMLRPNRLMCLRKEGRRHQAAFDVGGPRQASKGRWNEIRSAMVESQNQPHAAREWVNHCLGAQQMELRR